MSLTKWYSGQNKMSIDISLIKEELYALKEYVNSDICKKCEEIATKIIDLEKRIAEYSNDSRNS